MFLFNVRLHLKSIGYGWRRVSIGLLCLLGFLLSLLCPVVLSNAATAQTEKAPQAPIVQTFPRSGLESDAQAEDSTLSPDAAAEAVASSQTANQANDSAEVQITEYDYRLPFNRDSTIGNRIRLEGVYAETDVYFSRPRNWDLTSAKVRVR